MYFNLWPGTPPGALGDNQERDIPTLTAFLPGTPNGAQAAVIVCPGGAYGMLASYEGDDYALWLNSHGIAAFVLKYRLGTDGYRHPQITADVKRAVRLIRFRCGEWDLRPDRIGLMGSSAGGHLASVAATQFDSGDPEASDAVERMSSRPDMAVLCYPVISMGALAHTGSRDNFLGPGAPADLRERFSSELHVSEDTPPCFIWHTRDDAAVPVENAITFALALQEKGVSYSLHIYPTGPHGIALGPRPAEPDAPMHPWTDEFAGWLKYLGYIPE